MDNNQLKQLVANMFSDNQLDQDEKSQLRDLTLSLEQTRYMRNIAF